MSSLLDQLVVHRRHRVLPDQHLGRDLGAEVADDRAHVAVGQLEPGAGERVGEGGLVVLEPPGDRLVDRVVAQRQVGGQHPRLALAVAERLRCQAGAAAVLGPPLLGPGRRQELLPLVAEQDVEELVVPPGRVVGPGDLDAAGDGVLADAGAVGRLPAEALQLDRRGLRVGADALRRAGAVGLAEGVAAGDQRDGLLVVHRHPAERLADVAGRGEEVAAGVRALGVDVDEAHRVGAERLLELVVGAPALGAEPLGLRAPVHVGVRLVDVDPAAGEAEGLEAARLQGHVARQDDQVGPGDLLAVLLLDRPQQPPGLVQAHVVRPAVQRREALLAGACAAPAVAEAVGARGVPGHPDEQPRVAAEVGRPPVLGVGQHRRDVGLDRGQVEGLELLAVVELAVVRVGGGRVLGEDLQVEAVGPPLTVGVAQGGVDAAVRDRAALRARPRGLLRNLRGLTVGNDRVVVLSHKNPSGLVGSCYSGMNFYSDAGRDVRSPRRGRMKKVHRGKNSRRTGPSRSPRPHRG